jgi:hypothetical protein
MQKTIRSTMTRRHLRQAAIAALVIAIPGLAAVSTQAPKFYDDDPIAREPEPADASGAKPWKIGLLYDLSYNLAVVSRHVASGLRAQNINTIDEVPDSSWFTNRIGTTALTPDEVVKGPLTGAPPNPERWTIIREKSSGMTPGFTAVDGSGETWFLSFDYKWREGDSAAVVIANKLFWALGYHQVESFITSFDRARAQIDPKATVRRPNGKRTPYTQSDLDEVLERAFKQPDGSYRAVAGRLLKGTVLGGFRYAGTRPDDPNDIVPHEHRRELRALRVFGAWTNLTDLKAGNTLDAIETVDGRGLVRHYLQDVGSTFGTANGPHEYDIGWEHFWEGGPTWRRFLSFGFLLSPWQTVDYEKYETTGRFEGNVFDPRAWKPQTPTVAYMEMRDDDAFWAARRVAAFTDEQINAAVHSGQLSDPAAERHLASVLMARRDRIAQTYLPAVNPIVNPTLDADGSITVENAAVAARVANAPERYHATWSRFDNATGQSTALGQADSTSARIAVPGSLSGCTGGLAACIPAGGFVEVDVTADAADHPAWKEPARMFFRKSAGGWKLVGLERLPDKPGPAAGRAREGTR